MSRNLRLLNALRAFEAAARLGSFTNAASELGVTSAAVGQQVRGLEAHLGASLFERGLDGLTLTPEAVRGLPQIRRGFDLLGEGFEHLQPDFSVPQECYLLCGVLDLYINHSDQSENPRGVDDGYFNIR